MGSPDRCLSLSPILPNLTSSLRSYNGKLDVSHLDLLQFIHHSSASVKSLAPVASQFPVYIKDLEIKLFNIKIENDIILTDRKCATQAWLASVGHIKYCVAVWPQ